jgi:hypothetical protein
MPNPWFRMYTDFLEDPKMLALAFEDQRHFIGVLALKSAGTLDQDCEPKIMDRLVAQRLWIDHSAILEVKRRLMDADLIDSDWQPVSWDKRQFRSDHDPSGAERQRKYRERQRNALRHGRVTLPDTDTDTDTEQKKKGAKATRFRPPTIEEITEYCAERKNGIDPELFHAHYTSVGWKTKGGTKLSSWKAAVTTWEKRNAADRKTGNRNNSHATLSRIAAEDDPEELGGAPVSEVHGGVRAAVDGEYRKH